MIIAGCARNISQFWKSTEKSLQIIFDSLPTYKCFIIESNSEDNTLDLLKEWALKDSRRIVVSLGWLTEPSRTRRISICRNKYMQLAKPYFSQFPHIIILDLDDILNIQDNFKEQLDSCFLRDDWDCIASNRLDKYYDIWALRSSELGIGFDCLEMATNFGTKKLSSKGFQRIKENNFIDKFQINIPQNSNWILCESAFGGMALYKTSAIKFKEYNGYNTCEHVEFNEDLRIYINPFFISG